jgi:5-methylcytosine-specific restriction endonuclease McrA
VGVSEVAFSAWFLDSVAPDDSRLPLLRADPHQWGAGAVHLIDVQRGLTRCGKGPGVCPGKKFWGELEQVTCKICLASITAAERAAEAEQERAERERQREEEDARWWRLYDAYLRSDVWREKRAAVMQRADGRCEGCLDCRASQVHHRRYPRNCWPGSDEWIRQEKLFDLVAICEACHDDVHAAKRTRKAAA